MVEHVSSGAAAAACAACATHMKQVAYLSMVAGVRLLSVDSAFRPQSQELHGVPTSRKVALEFAKPARRQRLEAEAGTRSCICSSESSF